VTSPRRCCRRAADRVVGAEYPSLDDDRASDGVGEGEMTRGVAGTAPGFRGDDISAALTEKGGRAAAAINPARGRLCTNQGLEATMQGVKKPSTSEDGMMGRFRGRGDVRSIG
jgi:hypothetical protein